MSELLTGSTIGLNQMKKMREETIKKWSELGFLEGLSGHVNENIAQLYCCQASTLLNEKEPWSETLPTPNLPKDLHTYIKRDDEESEGTSTDGSTI
jgi:hypothetical protein